MDYTCYLLSNKPQFYNEIQDSIYPQRLHYFDGTNIGSFSKLVNKCVESCPTEIVICMSDKVRPESGDIEKIVRLINNGFGFVGLYRFGFFGFKKELFRAIGPLDERFISGGYEDNDFYIRIREADISMYITEEVKYLKSSSSWDYSMNKPHFIKKWIPNFKTDVKLNHQTVSRQLTEESYKYNFGESNSTAFLPWNDSVVEPKSVAKILQLGKFKIKDNN